MVTRLAWVGDGAARMEVARVERGGHRLTASGTQLGVSYELRYALAETTLELELVGERSLELGLGGADFFDVGWSPLFNSLPVLRDELLSAGPARSYTMRWVEIPSLEVSISEQTYEPLGDGRIRFTSGEFSADIQFDELGYVLHYPEVATRVSG